MLLFTLAALFAARGATTANAILGDPVFTIRITPDTGTLTTEFCFSVTNNTFFERKPDWNITDSHRKVIGSGKTTLRPNQTYSECFHLPADSPEGSYRVLFQESLVASQGLFTVRDVLPPAAAGLSVVQKDAAVPNSPWWFVRGGGYRSNESVSWWLDGPDGATVRKGDVVADGNGNLTVIVERVQLPVPGEYTFGAKQGNEAAQAVKFTFIENAANNLTVPYPEGINVTPTNGLVGTPFVVKARGFGNYTILYQVAIAEKGVVAQGSFEARAPYASAVYEVVVDTNLYGPGDYQVIVYEEPPGTVRKTVQFTAAAMPDNP